MERIRHKPASDGHSSGGVSDCQAHGGFDRFDMAQLR
jgi:hypothetical protein